MKKNTYYAANIYVKNKRTKLCTAVFETKQSLELFVANLENNDNYIRIAKLLIKKSEITYVSLHYHDI